MSSLQQDISSSTGRVPTFLRQIIFDGQSPLTEFIKSTLFGLERR